MPTKLILPDQDILNALYGSRILPLDDTVYNYDPRDYDTYLLLSGGEKTMTWIMEHTAVLHFCGRFKPWKPNARGRFVSLYKYFCQFRQPDCPTKTEYKQKNSTGTIRCCFYFR